MTSTRHASELRDLVIGPLLLIWVAALVSVAPIPELAFILEVVGLGGVLGLIVAYLRVRNGSDEERWRPVAQFSIAGFLIGVATVAIDLLVRTI
jgi:hypothetical protein